MLLLQVIRYIGIHLITKEFMIITALVDACVRDDYQEVEMRLKYWSYDDQPICSVMICVVPTSSGYFTSNLICHLEGGLYLIIHLGILHA